MSAPPSSRRASIVAATLALVLGVAGSARGQDQQEIEDARREFREALSQEAAGDWAGALGKLETVARVKLTAQVRYHIARCKEHLGRYTEALGDYRIAEFEAKQQAPSELDEITRARTDLEQRVPRLVVVLPKRAAGATVELDGVELGPAQLAEEMPVNPGPHRLSARIGKGEPAEKTFNAAEGETSRVKLSPKRAGAADADAPATQEPVTVEPGASTHDATTGGAGPWPWVAAGVGVAGLVGAGVFYGLRQSAERELDGTCRADVCPQSLQARQDDSDRDRLLSGISLGVGVVGLGTAAVLWLSGDDTRPAETKRAESSAARLRFDAQLTGGFRGASVRGAF